MSLGINVLPCRATIWIHDEDLARRWQLSPERGQQSTTAIHHCCALQAFAGQSGGYLRDGTGASEKISGCKL
jgi:hypothetical protein